MIDCIINLSHNKGYLVIDLVVDSYSSLRLGTFARKPFSETIIMVHMSRSRWVQHLMKAVLLKRVPSRSMTVRTIQAAS